jgi:D-aminopeptidase
MDVSMYGGGRPEAPAHAGPRDQRHGGRLRDRQRPADGPPVRARELIEDGAKRALSDLTAVAPWSPGSPCEIRVEFKHTLAVDELRFRSGVEHVDDRTISVTADTWWEAWKTFYF